MNILINTLIASSLVLSVAGPASAEISKNIKNDVYSAAGDYRFRVKVIEPDTVILSGYVEDSYAKNRAEYAARKAGAERVINRLFRE